MKRFDKYTSRHVRFCFFIALLVLFTFSGFITHAQEPLSLDAEVASPSSARLTWNCEYADSTYYLLRSSSPQEEFFIIHTVSGQTGSICFYDSAVKLGKTYYYKLALSQNDTLSLFGSVTKLTITLSRPQNLSVSTGSKPQVTLSWDKAEQATGYEVYRSTTRNKGYKRIGKPTKNRFTDYNVKNGKAYYYKVYAVKSKNKALRSQASNIAAAYRKPDIPSFSGFYSKKKMKLTWEKVKGADAYYIYKKNRTGKYDKIGQTDQLYYYDKSVVKGNTYQYKIAASYSQDGKTIKSKLSPACRLMASSIDPNKKMIALTFDDGPGPYTAAIVDCLKNNDGKATFFVVGNRIDTYKNALLTASEAGCEIANHSYSHPVLSNLSEREIKNQITLTDKKIKAITGQSPKLMRAPYGAANGRVKKTVKKPIIFWSIDTLDWKTRSRDKTVSAVINNVQDGDIVLMHDIHEPTKNAALILIPKLKKMGYQLVTVSELAQYRGYQLENGTVYHSLRKK